MDTAFVKQLYTAEGPWCSVYLPTARDETDAAHQIELRWRELRAELAGQGAPEADLRAIDERVGADRGLDTPRGQAIFASRGVVALEREQREPWIDAYARFGDLPDLVPLLEQSQDQVDHLVVFADREGAQIAVRECGRELDSDSVTGRDRPLTKVAPGDWAQDRYQRRAENTWQHNAREVAAKVQETAERHDVGMIAVTGDVRARTLLGEELSPAWRERTVELAGSGAPGADRDAVYREAEQAAAAFEQEQRAAAVDRYRQSLAADSAVQGLRPTIDALRSGRVETLLVRPQAPEAEAPLWWGPEYGQLAADAKELDEARSPWIKRSRAVDALIRDVALTGGDLLLFAPSEPGPEGFVGATLRRG